MGEIGAVDGFIGGVSVEEPHAAVVARDVLSAGGTASDAVIAAFFTLSVTYPIGAGLAGGGACVVYDPATNQAQGIEFLPRPAASGGAVAVPGVVRGMAALHARYGRLGWGALVAPGERMARFGHNVSRAFARRLQASERKVLREPGLRGLFGTRERGMIREGDPWTQFELASMLTQIRSKGAGDLYGGTAGRIFIDGAEAIGGKLTLADLRDYRANWLESKQVEFGQEVAHFLPATPRGLGVLHALATALRPGEVRASTDARVQAIAEAYGRGGGVTRQTESGDVGVAAGAADGSVAACTFTMGRAFGSGRIARGTGLVTTSPGGWDSVRLSPLVVVNPNVNQGYLALAGSGPAGASAAAQVAIDLLEDSRPLDEAIGAGRLLRLGTAGEIRQEAREGSAPASGAKPAKSLGRVQAIWCPAGLFRGAESCRFATDPRGFGLALGAAL